MRVLLSDQELIACRAIAERTEKHFDGDRAEAFAAAKARLAAWRRGGHAFNTAKLASLEHPIVGARRVAVQVNADGWFKIRKDEQVVADAYLVARIASPSAVEFVGWTTPEAFAAGAKSSRGRVPSSVYQCAKNPADLFGAPIEPATLADYGAMTLRDFASRDEALFVRSAKYGNLWLISAEAARRHVETGDPVYTAEEAIEVAKLPVEAIDRLHAFKRATGGTVATVERR